LRGPGFRVDCRNQIADQGKRGVDPIVQRLRKLDLIPFEGRKNTFQRLANGFDLHQADGARGAFQAVRFPKYDFHGGGLFTGRQTIL
jgi:hypothetical protein